MKLYIITILLVFTGMMQKANAQAIDSIPAQQKDVSSPDAIIVALYEVISGKAGETRNWKRMRTLFKPEASMIPSGKKPDGTPHSRFISVEEYIKVVGPQLEKNGFFETEIGRATHQFGNMMEVFSAYESKRNSADEKPFIRGINSIQLWNDGKRWWIMNIFWQSETPDTPIPEKFLKKE
jgi:hypothetical protein